MGSAGTINNHLSELTEPELRGLHCIVKIKINKNIIFVIFPLSNIYLFSKVEYSMERPSGPANLAFRPASNGNINSDYIFVARKYNFFLLQ